MFPYDFIIDALYPLQLRHKKMFGVDSFYDKEKIVFALRKKEEHIIDNGVWIATKTEHHSALKNLIKDLRPIQMYGIKTWLVLPEDSDHFEESVLKIAELIKQESMLIGNLPMPKKKRK